MCWGVVDRCIVSLVAWLVDERVKALPPALAPALALALARLAWARLAPALARAHFPFGTNSKN